MSKKLHKYQLTIDTLNNITGSLVEHQEQLNNARVVNLIDHYRDYIENYTEDDSTEFPLIKFESFITNQSLLNSASARIALDTGESITPPKAI